MIGRGTNQDAKKSQRAPAGPSEDKNLPEVHIVGFVPCLSCHNSDNNLSGAVRCSVKEETGGDLGGECRMLTGDGFFFFFLTDKPFHFLEFKIPEGIMKSRKYPPIDFQTSPVAILSLILWD